MKATIVAMIMLLSIAVTASACTCVSPDPTAPVCEQIRTRRAALFVGKVEHVGSKTVLFPPSDYPLKMQIVAFQVVETFGVSMGSTVLVTDFVPGNGSCGFPFIEGKTYFVDTSLSKRDNGLYLNSCGYTGDVAESQDLLRLLRSTAGNDSATIFGTVKEYIGEKNFVAMRNKPISGAAVNLTGADESKTALTDASGWYLITGLASGSYELQVNVGSEYRPIPSHTVTLPKAGCAQVDLRTEAVEH